jgi:hypothetical protein
LLRIFKDDLSLQILGVYRIPCECGKVYIGQTGRSIEARFKEYMRHIRLDQPEESAVAQHSINTGHQIDFNVLVLDRESGYMDMKHAGLQTDIERYELPIVNSIYSFLAKNA